MISGYFIIIIISNKLVTNIGYILACFVYHVVCRIIRSCDRTRCGLGLAFLSSNVSLLTFTNHSLNVVDVALSQRILALQRLLELADLGVPYIHLLLPLAVDDLIIVQIAGFRLPNRVVQVLKVEITSAIKRYFVGVVPVSKLHPFFPALAVFEDFVSFDDRKYCMIGTGSHLEDVIKAHIYPLFIGLVVTP